ncbi:MAG: hypothetical protein V1738_02470, partial [Patescibacteria group bacterium]
SPDGRYVLTGSDDGTARLWDAGTGEFVREFTGHSGYVLSVAFSPDGRYVLTGSYDRTARLWDVETGETARELSGYGDITVRHWDPESGEFVRTIAGHRGWVMSVAFSPGGRRLVASRPLRADPSGEDGPPDGAEQNDACILDFGEPLFAAVDTTLPGPHFHVPDWVRQIAEEKDDPDPPVPDWVRQYLDEPD